MFKNRNNGQSGSLAAVLDSLKQNVTHGAPLVSQDVATAAFAMEGYNNNVTQQALQSSYSGLKAALETSMKGVAGLEKMSIAQEEAGIAAGFAAASPSAYLNRKIPTSQEMAAFGGDNTIVVNTGASSVDERRVSLEHFDEQANRNAMVYSMAYNAQAARQNEFGETFFPTVVQAPDQVGYFVNIKLIEVIDTQRRAISGAVQNFNRKNIIKAEIDSTILQNDITRLHPVLRSESEQFLLKDLESTISLSGEDVTTAPYAIGKKFSILGLSQTEVALQAGIQDESDAVDSAVKLSAIYVELAKGAVVKFNTKNTPTAAFNYSVQGNVRTLQLAFNTDTLNLTKNTKLVDGTALPASLLTAIGDNIARLSVGVFGSINQQQGDTSLTASDFGVAKVVEEDGTVLSLNDGVGQAVVTALETAKVIGYDLYAHRTNSNRRNRGQLVDVREMNYLYNIPVLPPISAIRPIANSDANDASLLQSLVQTTRTRANNAAVTKLLETRDYLKEYCSNAIQFTDDVEMLGAAAKLVTPTYDEVVLDVATMTDSIKSSDRSEDVVAVIINQVRDIAYRMYQASGYQAAADVQAGGVAAKPTVLIGTDPTVYRYLTQNGDTRTFGDAFEFKIVPTLDSRMNGQIAITFGTTANDGTPNPLHFGNMAWRPEMTLLMPMVRNGSSVMELTVQPQFEHIPNLPILGWVTVSGIKDIIASKATVNINQVAENKPVGP